MLCLLLSLDLDKWINDPPSDDEDEEDEFKSKGSFFFSTGDPDSHRGIGDDTSPPSSRSKKGKKSRKSRKAQREEEEEFEKVQRTTFTCTYLQLSLSLSLSLSLFVSFLCRQENGVVRSWLVTLIISSRHHLLPFHIKKRKTWKWVNQLFLLPKTFPSLS